jgi:hypothetical protein
VFADFWQLSGVVAADGKALFFSLQCHVGLRTLARELPKPPLSASARSIRAPSVMANVNG